MKTVKSVALAFREGSSDKLYNAAIVEESDGTHTVKVEWGRRGLTLQAGTKAEKATLEAATKAFEKVVKEKTSKGYTEIPNTNGETTLVGTERTGGREKIEGVTAQLLNPIEEDEAETYVRDAAWVAQRKYDGVRILAHLNSDETRFTNRKGQITSVVKEVEESLRDFPRPSILDGEIVPTDSGSVYWVFDLLTAHGDAAIRNRGYSVRHDTLTKMSKDKLGPSVKIAPCVMAMKEKRELVARLKAEHAEGVVFKRADAAYHGGRPASGGSQLKLKFTKTADVVLTEWKDNAFQMAVYDKTGKLVEIGRGYAGTTEESRRTLRRDLDADKPVVAEVRYLYATEGDILFQPVFMRRRQDKTPTECLLSQLVRTNREIEE